MITLNIPNMLAAENIRPSNRIWTLPQWLSASSWKGT